MSEQRVAELEAENACLREQRDEATDKVGDMAKIAAYERRRAEAAEAQIAEAHAIAVSQRRSAIEAQAAARAFAEALNLLSSPLSDRIVAAQVLAVHPGWLSAENGAAMVRLQENDEAKHVD